MFVLASVSIVRTTPVPSVLVLLDCFQEESTDNIGLTPLQDLPLLLADHFCQVILRQLTQLLASNGVHDQLCPLVNIEIDFLITVESQIMRIDALFAFLAKSLLEIRTDDVGRIFFLLFINILEFVDIIVKRIQQSLFFFLFLLDFSALEFISLEFAH
jgi:hypothetical protein